MIGTTGRGTNASLIIVAGFVFGVTAILPSDATATDHVIKIVSDYANLRMVFEPKYLQVEPGDQVTWVNQADEEYNVMTFPDGFPKGASAFENAIVTRSGESLSHVFDVPSTYEYPCLPHLPMGMHGLIIVERPSERGEFHQPSVSEIKAYRELMLDWFDGGDTEMLEREERMSVPTPKNNGG